MTKGELIGNFKSDIVSGNDGEVSIQYYRVKIADRVFVEVGLKGNYASEIIKILKEKGSFDNHLGRLYENKDHAQRVVLGVIKEIVEDIDENNNNHPEIKIRENEKYKIAYYGDGKNPKTYAKNWSNEEIKKDYKQEFRMGL